MDQEPEVIRQNIEDTRSDLTRKIEVLEQEVMGTVNNTTTAVAETVESVRDSVETTVENVRETIENTVDAVRDTFDLNLQTRRHPWGVVGGSVLAGYVLGSLLPSGRSNGNTASPWQSTPKSGPLRQPAYAASVSSLPPAPEQRSQRPSMLAKLTEQFAPEIQQIKGVAIGVAAAAIRDLIKDKVPEALQSHVQDMIHNVTHKLGGEDIKGPILPQADESQPPFNRQHEFASRP